MGLQCAQVHAQSTNSQCMLCKEARLAPDDRACPLLSRQQVAREQNLLVGCNNAVTAVVQELKTKHPGGDGDG